VTAIYPFLIENRSESSDLVSHRGAVTRSTSPLISPSSRDLQSDRRPDLDSPLRRFRTGVSVAGPTIALLVEQPPRLWEPAALSTKTAGLTSICSQTVSAGGRLSTPRSFSAAGSRYAPRNTGIFCPQASPQLGL
jgi:hypothetical protein